MNRRQIIVAVTVLVFATGVMGAVFLGSPNVKETQESNNTTTAHDETNSDGHHDKDNQDIGVLIDLTDQTEVSMAIKDFKYEKSNIKIKKGTTVTWTNRDSVKHNVMQEHENDNDAHDAPSKDEEKPDVLASRLLAKGESYSFTFNEVSSSPYHCSPHPYMKGSVTVVE